MKNNEKYFTLIFKILLFKRVTLWKNLFIYIYYQYVFTRTVLTFAYFSIPVLLKEKNSRKAKILKRFRITDMDFFFLVKQGFPISVACTILL